MSRNFGLGTKTARRHVVLGRFYFPGMLSLIGVVIIGLRFLFGG